MGCILYFFITVTFFSVSEVALLLYVAEQTSLLFTMLCCAFTGIVGGFFVRQQGLSTLAKIKKSLNNGEIPADEAIGALLLLIVGVLLCVPGFITDFMGFLIIIPFIRKLVASYLIKQFKTGLDSGQFKVYSNQQPAGETAQEPGRRPTGENEIENATIVEVVEDDNKERKESHDQKKPL
jgi:UPF0716 protein FxsA